LAVKKKPHKKSANRAKSRQNQNKPHGHFCYVCGEHKANEKFSGRGHANHICKACQGLPVAERNQMIALRKIDNMPFRWLSQTEIKWLRKRMHDSRPEVRDAAREAYHIKFPNYDRDLDKLTALKTPVLFSELDEKQKAEALNQLEDLIDDFFCGADYIPDDEDRDEILEELCAEVSETLNKWEPEPFDPIKEYSDPRFDFGPEVSFDERIERMKAILEADAEEYDPYEEPEEPEPEPEKELIADDALKAAFDSIVARFIAGLKADGIELPTFLETLVVAETERLTIRRFYEKDFGPLWAIMKKPEVMYAWEAGFKKGEVRKWLNRQYDRYDKDGYGYFAVTLKESGRLIGQAGLIKSEINGEKVTEIGYIFDNAVWGCGYAIEASRACVDLAFHEFWLDKLYATIRPENAASVRLAEKLGMRKIGEFIKTHQGKEMPHDIYMLEKPEEM